MIQSCWPIVQNKKGTLVWWGNCSSLQLPEHVVKRTKPQPLDTEHLASWRAATILGFEAKGHPAVSQGLFPGCSARFLINFDYPLGDVFLQNRGYQLNSPWRRLGHCPSPLILSPSLSMLTPMALSPHLVALYIPSVCWLFLRFYLPSPHFSPELQTWRSSHLLSCPLECQTGISVWMYRKLSSWSSCPCPTDLPIPVMMATPSFQMLRLKPGHHP